MKILNIMLSRGLGGVQQSFLDYGKSLKMQGNHVINIVSLCSKITPQITGEMRYVLNLCSFDPISLFQISRIIAAEKPDIIIAHGNRAMKFCIKAGVPLIGVAHNYNIKWLLKCDRVLATTNHLQNYLLERGFEHNRVGVIPNMIALDMIALDMIALGPQKQRGKSAAPVVIGAMGRFVKKKGFDIFLVALSMLKGKGVEFRAIIGGEGEEEGRLKQLSSKLGLDSYVTFLGWVSDKGKFFDQIDIFCLPSTHEPFGIILLEAMARCKAVISTRSEGPSEILEDKKTGLLCAMTPVDMADKLARVIEDHEFAKTLGSNAYLSIAKKYDINLVGKILHNHLEQILHDIQSHKAK